MKKFYKFYFLLVVGFLLALAAGLKADPALQASGDSLFPEGYLTLGTFPGANSGIKINAYAMVNMTKGAPVVISTSTSYPLAVTLTTTAADPKFLGIVDTTVTTGAGTKVTVTVWGVTRATVAVSSTIGQKFIPSGTAGKLTGVATVAEGLYTPLSTTAMLSTALETRTVSGGAGSVYMLIGH